MTIERKNLREQVRDELLARIRSGSVRPGEGINEVQLAAELGVSRTPLREALISLETEGQIESSTGKGFRFTPLRARELIETAPILAALEGLAIELTDPEALTAIAARLATLAAEFPEDTAAHGLLVQRDDEWHGLMLSACPNHRLLDLIASQRHALHRFESLLVSDEEMVTRSAAEHAEIAACLLRGDLAGAKAGLRQNWEGGTGRLIAGVPPAALIET